MGGLLPRPHISQFRIEGEDGVDLDLFALRLAPFVPFHGDGARLEVDPGNDRRVDTAWNRNFEKSLVELM